MLPKPEFSSTTTSTLNTRMLTELYRGIAKIYFPVHAMGIGMEA
jgi:nitrous oxide reductase accessory protein NosL